MVRHFVQITFDDLKRTCRAGKRTLRQRANIFLKLCSSDFIGSKALQQFDNFVSDLCVFVVKNIKGFLGLQIFLFSRIPFSLGFATRRAGRHGQIFLTRRLNKLCLLLRSTTTQTLGLLLQRRNAVTQRFVGRLQQLVEFSLLGITLLAFRHAFDLVVQVKTQLPQTHHGLGFSTGNVTIAQFFQRCLNLASSVHDLRRTDLRLAQRCAGMRCFFQRRLYIGCTQVGQFFVVVLVRCRLGPFDCLKRFQQLVVGFFLDGSLTTRFNAVTHCADLVLLRRISTGYAQQRFFAWHAQSCGQLRRFLGSDLLNRWERCADGNSALGRSRCQHLCCTLFFASSAALFAGTRNVLKQALKFLGLHVAADDVAGFWREPALRIVKRFFGILVTNEGVQQRLCLLLALGKSVAEFVLHKLRLLRVSQINVAIAQT